MAKKFEGLDAMIQPTVKEEVNTKESDKEKVDNSDLEYVNSNVPLLKEHHLQLRILAMKQDKTLKQLIPEIIEEYLKQYKDEL